MSEGAEIHRMDVEDADDDLPPHRAAIPVAPSFLVSEKDIRRRNIVWLTVVFSLALHVGFFLSAVMWGQGKPLPDADALTSVIRVQVASITPTETVIEKTPVAEAPSPPRTDAQLDQPVNPVSAPEQPNSPLQEPGPRELTAAPEIREARGDETATPFDTASQMPAPSRNLEADAAKSSEQQRFAALPSSHHRADPDRASAAEPAKPYAESYKPPSARRKSAGIPASSRADENIARPAVNGASRGAIFSYKRRIRARVIRNLPEGRWGPGRVIVGFRVSRSGELTALSVMRSSGNLDMDRAALASIRTAGPFPAPPRDTTSAPVKFSIDFRFQ
jgi:protein TonB